MKSSKVLFDDKCHRAWHETHLLSETFRNCTKPFKHCAVDLKFHSFAKDIQTVKMDLSECIGVQYITLGIIGTLKIRFFQQLERSSRS